MFKVSEILEKLSRARVYSLAIPISSIVPVEPTFKNQKLKAPRTI
jgi:hypothetical protein